ncbi:Arf-GAP domain-containing protein [Aphelenchoides besseyi]|nr:Arf-GAP domain-containing protein [Aphelenchoides besseyi]
MVETDEESSRFCADCGGSASHFWASLNRGVIICPDCCYVHRSLGRHISHIRSLSKGVWNGSQLELVLMLWKNGANNIWEHTLVDPQNQSKSKKKPNSNDPIIPKKESFIKAKYVQHAFTIRPPKSEDGTAADLNRQLWSCSQSKQHFDFLALGADPNYADSEKGNTSMHIAAKEGQILQVELLWIYGADVAQKNAAGLTPTEVARMEEHYNLAARLEELEFEMTDRLSYFLCGRRPEHSKGVHFLIPELVSPNQRKCSSISSFTSNHFVCSIREDVYDEVDRRETSVQWDALKNMSTVGLCDPKHVAVFLPPNPNLSATRNQLRQKLAKYEPRDFSQLIIDILKEARRRFLGQSLPTADESATPDRAASAFTGQTEDSRDYDDVAEVLQRKSNVSNGSHRSSSNKSESVEKSRAANTNNSAYFDDILELREKVQETNQRISSVVTTNQQISREIAGLQTTIKEMDLDKMEVHRVLKSIQDSLSMLTRRNATSPVNFASSPALSPKSGAGGDYQSIQRQISSSNTERQSPRRQNLSRNNSAPPDSVDGVQLDPQPAQRVEYAANHARFPASNIGQPPLPDNDNLIVETEMLIVAIKKLLADIRDSGSGAHAMYHADSIDFHIKRIVETIPRNHGVVALQNCINDITDAMASLASTCSARPFNADDAGHSACRVAKYAKQLLLAAHGQAITQT